jgi:hypothetical protein
MLNRIPNLPANKTKRMEIIEKTVIGMWQSGKFNRAGIVIFLTSNHLDKQQAWEMVDRLTRESR